ncbi:DUF1415 domain-containing protein [Bermanella marisrubri]|uniref:DUF1415 domain-containing protein n=1 Tax=Bermanella marisrubri TaxID=207949 RepID=Q1N3P1_9GAMM|nr:DUF1415 domain-containing protein [Bermanella marisrubri]EAT12833.1 hypothetical protein RED65_12209 [Oceanobacter sp. RED65] [Bermanella marisrubri]QIZ83154.1 DUF1415 domain-containing protein [Bermanella marisrubri]
MSIETDIWQWLDNVVIDLNLCPFARKPRKAKQIRLALFTDRDLSQLDQFLLQELEYLMQTPSQTVETTLIATPYCLAVFEDYLDYLDQAQWLLERAGLEGIIQIASFHPNYQFSETQADDPSNLTNVAPYPILHLIREDSLEEVLKRYPDPEQIPENNIKLMKSLTQEDKARLFPYRAPLKS